MQKNANQSSGFKMEKRLLATALSGLCEQKLLEFVRLLEQKISNSAL